MRNYAIVAGLAFGLGLIPGCQRTAEMPRAEPTQGQEETDQYGIELGDRATGAVGGVESEEESGGHFATMADMLRGRVPGLQLSENANGEISVRIRGDQSILFNQEPLLVVNGIPTPPYSFSSTLRSMDPRSVRSIRVLKDAGSTSSYGSRGAHGVILITLKRM